MGSSSSRLETPAGSGSGANWPVQAVATLDEAVGRASTKPPRQIEDTRGAQRRGSEVPPPPYEQTPTHTPQLSPSLASVNGPSLCASCAAANGTINAANCSRPGHSSSPLRNQVAVQPLPPIKEVKKSRKQRKAETKLAKTQAVWDKEEAKRAKKQAKKQAKVCAKAQKTAGKAKVKAEKSARKALKKARKAQTKAEHSSEDVPKRVQKAREKALKAHRRAAQRAEKAEQRAQLLAARATSYATTPPPSNIKPAHQRAVVNASTPTLHATTPAASVTTLTAARDVEALNTPTPVPPVPRAVARLSAPETTPSELIIVPPNHSARSTMTSATLPASVTRQALVCSTSSLPLTPNGNHTAPPRLRTSPSDFALSPVNGYTRAASTRSSPTSTSESNSPLTPPDSPFKSLPRAPTLPPRTPRRVPPMPQQSPFVDPDPLLPYEELQREREFQELTRDLKAMRV